MQITRENIAAESISAVAKALQSMPMDTLFWKSGINARSEVYMTALSLGKSDGWKPLSIEEIAALPTPDYSKFQWCGLVAVCQGREFPLNQLQLHSGSRGHVATLEFT